MIGLAKFGRATFSQGLRKEPLILFASYPVGFPMLLKLHQTYESLSVVTHYSDSKKIKQNQVETYCKSHNIPVYTPVKKEETKEERAKQWEQFVEIVKNTKTNFKMGIACSYGYMLPQNVINLFEKGMVLAHPSLIPKYRGGSPIFHAIANGEKQSGASFMQISPHQFDHGNLLYQVKCELGEKDSYQKVQKDLSQLMAEHIIHVIDNVDSFRPGRNQSDFDVSGIPPHQLEAKIYRQKKLNVQMKAQQVYNWSRALITPRVVFNDKQIIVFFDKVFKQDENKQFSPGQIALLGKHLYMKCEDKLIKLTGWKQMDKKQLAIHTFINRFIDKEKYKNEIFFK